jgi:hypothetical protein
MKQVTLETLFCETTEDTFGSDSCRLEIYADGELDQALRAELNNGEQWAVNATVLFASQVDVRLFDEDGGLPGDDDDALGVVQIAADDAFGAVGVFDQDGADYRLTYTVTDRSDLPATDVVEQEIQDFEASRRPACGRRSTRRRSSPTCARRSRIRTRSTRPPPCSAARRRSSTRSCAPSRGATCGSAGRCSRRGASRAAPTP